MILFFKSKTGTIIAADAASSLSSADIEKLVWLFNESLPVKSQVIEGLFTGPRKEMITPWSTNAVEITQNMGITGLQRI